MKISLLCFTDRGFQTEKKLTEILRTKAYQACPWVMGKYAMQAASMDHSVSFLPVREGGLTAWAGERFLDSDAILFIGACGIAVRAIAPHVKDKRTDPAVLVADEAGRYVIPILSGHLGGANQIAVALAEKTGAEAVITTATDVNKKFAVDVFAKEHGLVIDSIKLAKEISAELLSGKPVGVFSDFPLGGELPDGLLKDTICGRSLRITVWKKEKEETEPGRMLKLIPRCVALGIGCRRGTPKEKIREELEHFMEENRLDLRSVWAIASIDLKSGEPGLCGLSADLNVPFLTYSAEELSAAPGEYEESEFVKSTTGVGNVCGRAAVLACMEGARKAHVLVKKRAGCGVTFSAACFYPELFS